MAISVINDILKYFYFNYFNKNINLVRPMTIGYVFHTESIYDIDCYSILLDFVRSYKSMTGEQCVLTIMTPENCHVKKMMHIQSCENSEFLDRVLLLSEYAEIGYHGHFYRNDTGIKSGNNVEDHLLISDQFDRELLWLDDYVDSFIRVYAAGWWHMSDIVIKKLLENDFIMDFSFTHSGFFGCDYSKEILRKNSISLGQPFTLKESSQLVFLQNFIGCHDNKFPEDFMRRMNLLINSIPCADDRLYGVVNNHDFNLSDGNDYNTLKCIERALDCNVNFINPINHKFENVKCNIPYSKS